MSTKLPNQMKAPSAQTASPSAGGLLQRKCDCGQHTIAGDECEKCGKEKLQRSAAGRAEQPQAEAPPIVHEVLRSTGQPLDRQTRAFMESRFAHDFSHVRVHTDGRAAQSARAVNALAYTVGHDLVFASGEYKPQGSAGKRLLAHELAHVLQQSRTSHNPGMQHRLRVSDADDPAEREAEMMAERSLASPVRQASTAQAARVTVSQFSPMTAPTIQRQVTASMGTIKDHLTYRILDWAITDKEAREVLDILKTLSDQDLKDTVAEMEREGLVGRFFDNLAEEDIKANQEVLTRIKNARVYTEVTKSGGKTVTTTTTGSCSPAQNREISVVVKEAVVRLDKAIAQLDAYLAKPQDASTKATQAALNAHFKSTTADVATYVRGQLNRLRFDLSNLKLFSFECHENWDLFCGVAGAYVPGGDREKVIFCNSFFEGESKASNYQTETLTHEMAHTQVGGTNITDRAYDADRILKHLTTEEALTNAESYSLFVKHLVSGKLPPTPAPADTYEDCPKDWETPLEKALARAQRWNREVQVSIAKLTPEKAKEFSKDAIKLMGGTTQEDIDALRKAVNDLATALDLPIDFECEPKGGGRCEGGARTYWYAAGDFHICPSWTKDTADEQVVWLLAGLYGYKADVDDNTRRLNYAHFAQNHAKVAAPALSQILGSAKWKADYIRILFQTEEPKILAKSYYEESGARHERMSDDLPDYQVEPCQSKTLPFHATVLFYVDLPKVTRPAPFTPPSVSVEFRFMTRKGPFKQSVSDPRVDYARYGYPLITKFPREFKFDFDKNGPLEMKFELKDADTGVNRVYEDTIQVDTERLCDIPNKPSKNKYA
jgi:hypothetical protein